MALKRRNKHPLKSSPSGDFCKSVCFDQFATLSRSGSGSGPGEDSLGTLGEGTVSPPERPTPLH